jgi:hypothetical protein
VRFICQERKSGLHSLPRGHEHISKESSAKVKGKDVIFFSFSAGVRRCAPVKCTGFTNVVDSTYILPGGLLSPASTDLLLQS